MERLKEHLRESRRALRAVFHNRSLRQLQLAWAGSIIGTWAYAIALVVFAYDHGGASTVGLVALIREQFSLRLATFCVVCLLAANLGLRLD